MTAALEQFAEDFALLPDWEERYAHVIALGRALAPLQDSERTEANKVRGCASQVWLVRDPDGAGGVLHFRADSDAHIVRGLLAIILGVYTGRTAEQILAIDPATLLDRLHLREALTPQRSNGVASVLARIQAAAAQSLSEGPGPAR